MRQRGHAAAQFRCHFRRKFLCRQFISGGRQLADQNVGGIIRTGFGDQCAQRHFGCQRGEFFKAQLVVSEVAVSPQSAVPVGLRHFGFQRENIASGFGRVSVA